MNLGFESMILPILREDGNRGDGPRESSRDKYGRL